MIWLALGFLLTALLYSSVGFGGGSTYNALLVLSGADFRYVPVVALACNLVVVTGGTVLALRQGLLRLSVALPLTLGGVPMAFVGGATPIGEASFLLVLGLCLVGAGALLLLRAPSDFEGPAPLHPKRVWPLGLPLGAGFGWLAGLVGIGGGIFLAPVLHLLRVVPAKVVAATASFFIFANSIAGLVGQAIKLRGEISIPDLELYAWLPIAVLVGGQVGSRLGLRFLSEQSVRRITALLVLYVGLRLLYTWVGST